jgi:type II secretion system protein C
MSIFLKKYTWVLNLLMIFIGTYFLAKIGSTLLASKIRVEKKFQPTQVAGLGAGEKKPLSFEDYRIVLERNIFDSREIEVAKEEEPEPQGEVNLEGPAVKTSLPVKIISTVSVGNGTDKRSSATITSGKGEGEIYTVEDEKQFSPGVKITKILPDRVEFVNNRRLEYAEIEGFGGGVTRDRPLSRLDRGKGAGARPGTGGTPPSGEGIQEVGEGRFVVDRAELDSAMGSLDKLFTQIRAVPQFKGGKVSGLKLLSVRRGSLFAKLGLRRNDVLERINGQTVDMKQGMQIFNQLKDSDSISIDLLRNGKKTTLQYDIQ